jgi:hypothetical protein
MKRRENILDFEKQESGYERLYPSPENFKKNIGKTICYVDFVEPYRGTFFVRYAVIHSVIRNRLILNDLDKEIDIRDIIDCGIKIETA